MCVDRGWLLDVGWEGLICTRSGCALRRVIQALSLHYPMSTYRSRAGERCLEVPVGHLELRCCCQHLVSGCPVCSDRFVLVPCVD